MNKTTKTIVWIIVLALAVWGLSRLGGKRETASIGGEPIKIGAPLPLTGVSASIGERVKHAMEIAQEEFNESSPFPLEFVFEDTKGESATAVSAVTKLINIDGVKVLIGLIKSDPLLAVAPITEQNKIILFSPTAGAEAISQAGDYVFRNIEIPDSHGKGAAEFFARRGINKVALFTANASNALSYSNAFQRNFEAGGGQIVFKTQYGADSLDFRTEIVRAKASGAEAAYIGVATAKDVGILVKQLRELNFEGTVVVSVAAEAKEFVDIAGSAAEGIIVAAAPFDPNSPSAVVFAQKFQLRYGAVSDGFAANGYDAVKLIILAIKSCGEVKTDCVRDYLYSVKNYDGVGGLTTFDKNGDVIKPIQLKVVKNGQFVRLVD
ncbi:ABC transporter substrate-binding protein [Candidatus Nomurabacteria bacterium]|nr:ABC transporter substrate-binding protein [Candidatus Nomurabacteria bacterium]